MKNKTLNIIFSEQYNYQMRVELIIFYGESAITEFDILTIRDFILQKVESGEVILLKDLEYEVIDMMYKIGIL